MKVTDAVSVVDVSFDRLEDVSISPRYYGRPVDDRTSMSRLSSVQMFRATGPGLN